MSIERRRRGQYYLFSHNNKSLLHFEQGIYNASYRAGAWAYIGETEELQVWRRSQPQTPLQGDRSLSLV